MPPTSEPFNGQQWPVFNRTTGLWIPETGLKSCHGCNANIHNPGQALQCNKAISNFCIKRPIEKVTLKCCYYARLVCGTVTLPQKILWKQETRPEAGYNLYSSALCHIKQKNHISTDWFSICPFVQKQGQNGHFSCSVSSEGRVFLITF